MSKTIGIVMALTDNCSPKLKDVAEKIGVTVEKMRIADRQLKKFNKELGKGLKQACKTAMVGLTALAGATALTVNKTREYADRVDDNSKKIGLSKKAYQEWDYIITRFGGNIDGLQMGMKALVNQTVGVTQGNKNAISNFKKLGISIKDTNGKIKSQEVLFEEVVSKMQKYPDGVAKAKLANDMFGRSGADLMPMFKENAQAISELKAEMQKLGIVMSDEQIEAANTFSDNLETIQRGLGAVMMSLGSELMPILNDVARTFIDNMPQIKETVIPVFKGIAGAVKFVTENISWLLPVASGLLTTFLAYSGITKTIAVIDLLKNAISAVNVVHGVWNALMLANPIGVIAVGVGALVTALALLIVNWDKVTGAIKRATEAVSKFLGINEIITIVKHTQKTVNNGRAVKIDGSHANGLSNVPFNGYIAELHKGERVLTASENRNYNTTTNTKNTNKTVTINFYGDIIGNGEFLNKIKFELGQELKKALAT